MSSFDYINQYYGLKVKRGTRVEYSPGGKGSRPGTVVSASGAHINIRFDDAPAKTVGPFHPTSDLRYLDTAEV